MSTSPIVAKISAVSKHPQASKLWVCTISPGNHQVVCGANNVRQDMVTIFAGIGAQLPSGKTIEPTELRGVESSGMLCSARDLGISDEGGIIDLPSDAKLGSKYSDIDQIHLSSTPWHQFHFVEQHVLKDGTISRLTTRSMAEDNAAVLSETYFDGTKYRYRKFSS